MTIGITDPMGADDRYLSYARWLSALSPEAELVRLSYRSGNLSAADLCDGIVLTGGGDVDPALYGGDAGHPTLTGVDPERDLFERQVMDRVMRRPRPLLGICRGMQFVNVYLGGTLLCDVEEAGLRSHRASPGTETLHGLTLSGSGILAGAVDAETAAVNTFHHQGVDRIGAGLTVAARANDGITEALEMPGAEQFFLLVQWHPERMRDQTNPCAGRIAGLFLEECMRYARQQRALPSLSRSSPLGDDNGAA